MGGSSLDEKNYGKGLSYNSTDWTLSVDTMTNSNRGKAVLVTFLNNVELMKLGGNTFGAKFGAGSLSYYVPKYDATAKGETGIAFIYLRCGKYYFCDGWTINAAPVPKMAGKAWILWLSVDLFKKGH